MAEPTAFTPAPTQTITAPTPLSYDYHIAPSFDVIEFLPPAAEAKLRALRLRSSDAHMLIPAHEEIRQANIAKMEAANTLKRLTDHPQMGGFKLPIDDRRVIVAQKTLDKLTAEAKRLTELAEVRAAAWRSTSGVPQAVEDWLKNGRPGGTALEVVEVEDVKLLKGETVLDAISRLRRRGRELKADLARIAAAPFPSSHAKRRMREQVERLAQIGTPDVSMLVEHDRDIGFQTQRVTSEVHADRRLLAFTQVPDAVALVAWLHKDALIAKLDAEIAAESDDAAALSHEARQQREAEVLGDLLAVERDECALVWQAQAHSLPVEHRSDINPLALLGLRLVTAPRAGASRGSSTEHAYDIVMTGRR